MATLKEIERVFACEVNEVISPPFPTSLSPSSTVDLCKLVVPVGRERNAFLVHALVDWSVTFVGLIVTSLEQLIPIPNAPGFAQVTFELLRDGGPIFSVIETISQVGLSLNTGAFIGSSTSFATTKLLHVDTTSLGGNSTPLSTFTLRATNVILTPPLASTTVAAGTVTAAAGAVTLVVEEIEATRANSLNA